MAGYTTRIQITSASSFVVACLSLIWYLRKKKLLSFETIVDKLDNTETNISQNKTDSISMNLKELSESTTQSSGSPNTSNNMHLKEKSGSSDKSLEASGVDSCSSNICNGSKMCENNTTCVSKTLTNGSSHPECDNNADNRCSMSKVKYENGSSEMNNSISDLSNGVKSIHFVTENTEMLSNKEVPDAQQITNNINTDINKSSNSDRDVLDKNSENVKIVDSEKNGIDITNVDTLTNELQNGDLCKEDLSTTEFSPYDVTSNEMFPSDLVNRNSINLSCETNFERKTLTPDSGVPGDLQECDSSSCTMSDHSSEFPLNGTHSDILKSPCVSESSNDSGKTSLQNFDCVEGPGDESLLCYEQEIVADPMHYDFAIPQELCGFLIGKQGRHVKYLVEETNAAININIHPFLKNYKVCTVAGTEEEIKHALVLIREKFPLERFPELTLEALNPVQTECTLPVTICLALPEGVTFEVLLSATVTPGHFFLQQPSHPTYHTLSWLTQAMTAWYSQCDAPKLFKITIGHVVAAPMCGGWYRAEVIDLNPDSNACTVKFLDFGGYIDMSTNELRQMKFEFAYVPFQAVECFLGNISFPEGKEGWSAEAKNYFEELAQGQILHGYIVYYDEGIPCVHLYKIQGATHTFINRELVNHGLARWTEH